LSHYASNSIPTDTAPIHRTIKIMGAEPTKNFDSAIHHTLVENDMHTVTPSPKAQAPECLDTNPFPLIGGHPYPVTCSTAPVTFPTPQPYIHQSSDIISEGSYGKSLENRLPVPVSTVQGVTIQDIRIGGGDVVGNGSYVIVWYMCTVLETGFVFDRSTTPDGSAVRQSGYPNFFLCA
jgi:hypothetical protein